jgi:hypothetical protein
MALSASTLGSLIDSGFAGAGANGKNRSKFSNALATGIVNGIVGKSFQTLDVGLVPGAGTGTGTGLTGLDADGMKQQALAAMKSRGANADKTMGFIMDSTVQHLAEATLTSVDTPVFAGTGTIVLGSITVTVADMTQSIVSALKDSGANGRNVQPFANAVATGIAFGMMTATGTLVIAGAGSPTPSPGTGSGTGEIS